MATDREAREALSRMTEQDTASRRREGTIIGINGRFASVVLDGEGTSIISAYRGSYEPAIGAGVTIERIPGYSEWKIVGVRDSSVRYIDNLPYDFERPGESLYYPLALEAINHWSYNLGDGLEITIYNAYAVNSNKEVQYQDEATFDLAADPDATNPRWIIFYMDDVTGVVTKYVADPDTDPQWIDAANDMMTFQYGVPGLAVYLDAAMVEWQSAWRALKRGYLFGAKKIIRLPFATVPDGNDGASPTLYYQTLEDNGTPVTQRGNLNLVEGSGVTLNFDDDGSATTEVEVSANEMIGATDSVDGTSGIVPQPLAGDEGKFLRGDGSWSAGASGAPDDAKYIVAESNGSLSNEVDLGALTTGLLKHSVAAGVSTPATATPGTDYLAPSDATSDAYIEDLLNYQTVQDNGSDETQRAKLNLIAGTNVTIDIDDNAGNDSTDVTINSSSGSGGNYQTVQDNGSDETQRAKLNFIAGTNVTLSIDDNAGNNSTDVTINSSGGSGAPDDAKYLVTASDATLSNELVLPGFAGHGDISGLGGGGINEEYDTTTPGLTWNSAPASVDSNTTRPSHLVAVINDDTERFALRAFTPAGDFDVRTKLALFVGVATGSQNVAFLVTDATNTLRAAVLFGKSSGNNVCQAYTANGATWTARGTGITCLYTMPMYFRLVRTSGTFTFMVSLDGYAWTTLTTYTIAITVTQIGFRFFNNTGLTYGIHSDFLRTNV